MLSTDSCRQREMRGKGPVACIQKNTHVITLIICHSHVDIPIFVKVGRRDGMGTASRQIYLRVEGSVAVPHHDRDIGSGRSCIGHG